MKIEQITENEIPVAANIIDTVFGKYGDKAASEFSRLFQGERHSTYAFLAKKGDDAVGVAACLETYFSFDVYAICWVGVLEEHRRQGICAELIRRVEEYIQNTLLEGRKGTIILAADITDYYQKLGYIRQDYPMHDGAFIMSKVVNT